MNIRTWSLYLLILTFLYTQPLMAEDGHDHAEEQAEAELSDKHEDEDKDEQGHEEDDGVHLNHEQRHSAGIVVETLTPRPVPTEIEAPGEIRPNAYASSQVTPRIEAQVVARHARLGEQVVKGQLLATLSSADMAEAQGVYLVAATDWQRIKKLAKEVVSEQSYLNARVAFQKAHAKLLAYGMTPKQTKELIDENNVSLADGQFTLLSPQDGTVIKDDFVIGQMVEPGELLFELTDESKLWVEVRVKPESVSNLNVGAVGRVLAGEVWIESKVIQIHHSLDEVTRTLAVRLEVPNPHDRLHPGQFVTARIQTADSGKSAISLPQDAVMRSPDGDWQVFVEEVSGGFEPKEVELIRQLPGQVVIEGLAPGTRVVTQGAFFVQSELAKSGFEVHNH